MKRLIDCITKKIFWLECLIGLESDPRQIARYHQELKEAGHDLLTLGNSYLFQSSDVLIKENLNYIFQLKKRSMTILSGIVIEASRRIDAFSVHATEIDIDACRKKLIELRQGFQAPADLVSLVRYVGQLRIASQKVQQGAQAEVNKILGNPDFKEEQDEEDLDLIDDAIEDMCGEINGLVNDLISLEEDESQQTRYRSFSEDVSIESEKLDDDSSITEKQDFLNKLNWISHKLDVKLTATLQVKTKEAWKLIDSFKSYPVNFTADEMRDKLISLYSGTMSTSNYAEFSDYMKDLRMLSKSLQEIPEQKCSNDEIIFHLHESQPVISGLSCTFKFAGNPTTPVTENASSRKRLRPGESP